jgi:pyrroline-5-carboxylate reductase
MRDGTLLVSLFGRRGKVCPLSQKARAQQKRMLSGSESAYFFRFVEAVINGAKDLGLLESYAKTLVIQTITGAAAMLNVEGASPSKLRENVTSPNGKTFAAVQVFESMDIEGIINNSMRAARDRSQELS